MQQNSVLYKYVLLLLNMNRLNRSYWMVRAHYPEISIHYDERLSCCGAPLLYLFLLHYEWISFAYSKYLSIILYSYLLCDINIYLVSELNRFNESIKFCNHTQVLIKSSLKHKLFNYHFVEYITDRVFIEDSYLPYSFLRISDKISFTPSFHQYIPVVSQPDKFYGF